jgi:hypothetical protein
MITPKTAPYADTEVNADKTIIEIEQLLRKYGITKVQWTKDWDVNQVRLRFAIEEKPGQFVPIQIEPAMFLKKHLQYNTKTGKNSYVEAPNWAQSMRLLLYYLKAKLEAIAYGLKEVRTEFMADIIVKDGHGGETTLGKAMLKQLPFSAGTDALELGRGQS